MPRLIFILVILTCATAFAQSPSACPWLTQGSAAKALGGAVRGTAQQQSPFQGSCRFTLQSDPNMTLDIDVGRGLPSLCKAAGTQLTSLGNEAHECHEKSSGAGLIDIIEGRVRETHFTIQMTHTADPADTPSSSSKEPGPMPAIEVIAEQVVGNLY